MLENMGVFLQNYYFFLSFFGIFYPQNSLKMEQENVMKLLTYSHLSLVASTRQPDPTRFQPGRDAQKVFSFLKKRFCQKFDVFDDVISRYFGQ